MKSAFLILLLPLVCQAAIPNALDAGNTTRAVVQARVKERAQKADAKLPEMIDLAITDGIDAGNCEGDVSISDASREVLSAQVKRLHGLGYLVNVFDEETQGKEMVGFMEIKWCDL